MSGALEKLQREFEAAQHALAEAEVRYARQEAEHQGRQGIGEAPVQRRIGNG